MSGNTHTMAKHHTPEALDLHIGRPTSKPHGQHEHPLITSKFLSWVDLCGVVRWQADDQTNRVCRQQWSCSV